MKFTKMHGLGNDYIYINLLKEKEEDFAELSKKWSVRHFGVGADGIITISKSNRADAFMQIYNADGSKGEMCGNGIRCVGKYLYDNGIVNKDEMVIDTLAGLKYLKLNIKDGKVNTVEVDMGEAMCHDGSKINKDKISHKINVLGDLYDVMDISVGNPHTVIFVPEITDYLVLEVGKVIESHEYYPNRTNVEFVKVIDDVTLEMRVYERGSGETYACGTGSCASAIAYMLQYPEINEVTVKLLGGDLKISWNRETNHIYMTGPATKVYDGEIEL